jgi:hypothetical protein
LSNTQLYLKWQAIGTMRFKKKVEHSIKLN